MANNNLLQRIELAARTYKKRPAIFASGRYFSYEEFFGLVRGIKKKIVKEAGKSQEMIAVATGDEVDTYASILAVLATGAAYVPINRSYPPARISSLLSLANVEYFLATRTFESLELARKDNPRVRVAFTESCEPEGGAPLLGVADADDLAYLFFTSGSTGRPKGVPISFKNLDAFFSMLLDHGLFEFSERDRFLQMFSLTFDLSVMSFFTPLAVGGCCCVVPDAGMSWIATGRILRDCEISVALMVPSVLSYLRRFFDEIRLEALRYSLFCGEALPQDLVQAWSRCVPNAKIQNVYGPTEATIFCTAYDWEPGKSAQEAVNGIVPIGRSLPGMRAEVFGEEGIHVKEGEKGELCLSGDQVSGGYFRDAERTRDAFPILDTQRGKRRYYRTGDLCFVNTQGDLVFSGRMDSQIKIDGHRVELGEIEHHAREFVGHSMVAAVLATLPGEGRRFLTLFVEDRGVDPPEMRAFLQSHLPEYMVPRRIVPLEKMPLNASGKIDRPALSALTENGC